MKKIYLLIVCCLIFAVGNAQIINFPDSNLKAKLLSSTTAIPIAQDLNEVNVVIDSNGDHEISQQEAEVIYHLFIGFSNISNMEGLQYFHNLRTLQCKTNQLTSLDLSPFPNLEFLNATENQITTLNVTGLSHLKTLECHMNLLTTINLTDLSSLEKLTVAQNHINALDFSTTPLLNMLNVTANQITTLDLSMLPLLNTVWVGDNMLTSLDLSHNIASVINCDNNNLHDLNIKNGYASSYTYFNFAGNPNLEYICIDDFDASLVQNKINAYGYTNCHFNSYCSFVPGGTFYSIQGTNKFDVNNDGCDNADSIYPNLKLRIFDGMNTASLIANNNGNYSYDVQAGAYTITPVLENAAYFNVSPTTALLTFPDNGSTFLQNFCITPNGIHNDLEVSILPIIPAIPGFISAYIICYKNKGNQTQSGTISFAYNDAVLDFVNANPVVSSQVINYLNWDFTDLQPFESRQIVVTLNLNSPSEIPPVNGGDILNFTASVNSASTDETPSDNTFVLNQTVVNSFDPNDKTCLEGNTITPEMVGKEVHYMIRFENTGTANAVNIVVKDMIDTTKFDVNSLIPINGSHPFVTKISAGNKVEFLFENIQLPFDDANNDGYVAFKIKTKPDLVVGNSFSNTASIYFDYNFPIVTNTATTTVALLANQDFAFGDYFKIYPNPVKAILNIETKQTIEVTSVNIYNTLGQLVMTIPNAQQTQSVDVSDLKTGNYFLKINSSKGTSSVKFVKM